MQSIRLGRTGLTVSRTGFGAIPIQRLSEAEAIQVIQACLDLGINFIDTAHSYTVSEERVGKAIAGRRDGLVVATKTEARTAKEAAEHLDLSLQRLQIDSIDLYQFHNVATAKDYETILGPGGAMETFWKAKADGKIKSIGFTSHSEELATKAVLSGLFETLQYPFNFIGNEAANGLIQLCRQHDVGFIAMKPLGGGLLEKASLAFKYIFAFDNVVPDPGIEKVQDWT
ncbi:MAG: aldo/keto reductase, partial [Chloroflexi bacterium]|nr:aldo/keto reductase [Chloroflexota bacterium]